VRLLRFKREPQWFSRPDQVGLAYDIVKDMRAQPFGQRCLWCFFFEQVHRCLGSAIP